LRRKNFIVVKMYSRELNISEEEIGYLVRNNAAKKTLQPESQRILQFHRLVLLMNVDQETSQVEIHKIREMGLHMGLRSEAIDTVLKEMHKYPNKVVPPKELLEIFTRFYN